jgi:alanine racemase
VYEKSLFDMARVGILLYGHAAADSAEPLPLRPILQLRTTVVQVKRVRKGEFVGYGRTFQAARDTTVATVPIGYADGLMRENGKNGGVMEVCGQIAPIIGGVCMDQCMLDVTEIEGVKLGDAVTVYGISGEISVEAVAARCATVPYEILCSLGERVPRVYLENGAVVKVVDRLESE